MCGLRNRNRGAGALFLPAGRARGVFVGQVAFSVACAACLGFGQRGTEGKGFEVCEQEPADWKTVLMEGKAGEGQHLEARLEKLVVPGREVLKHRARWLDDALRSEETLKGACESPRVTGLPASLAGRSVSCSGENPARFLHFPFPSLGVCSQLPVL